MSFHQEQEDKRTMSFHQEQEEEEEQEQQDDDDDDAKDFYDEVDDIFMEDDVERFVSTINREFKEKGKLMIDGCVDWPESEVLFRACNFGALKCAAAILDGKTPIKMDLNTPDEYGRYALHCAADSASAKAVGFLLSRGARTDIRGRCWSKFGNFKYEPPLPLQISLEKTCSGHELKSWNQDLYVFERTSMSFCKQPKQQSVFMLVTILCLPCMEKCLSKLRLLAWSTKETAELFLEFVRRGEVVKVAALLGVAHKKLMSKDVLSDADKNAAIPPVQQLFGVFERAGDAIDEYRKEKKNGESMEQTVDFVAKLLEQLGIVFDLEDIDITIYRWARYYMAKEWDYRTGPSEYGMIDGTGRKLTYRKELPFYMQPGESFDYYRAHPSRLPEELDEKEDLLKRKMKIEMRGWPSSQSQSSYNRPWLTNSSTMSFTKPKPPRVPSLSSSFSSKPWVPSLSSFLMRFGKRI